MGAHYELNKDLCPCLPYLETVVRSLAEGESARAFGLWGQQPEILASIVGKAQHYALSPKQVALLVSIKQRADQVLRDRVTQAENAKPIATGKREIVGEIKSLKVNDYGQLKTLLVCDGYKLWGTLPANIATTAKVGDRISLVATVATKEPGFGFWSRPAKGQIIPQEQEATA